MDDQGCNSAAVRTLGENLISVPIRQLHCPRIGGDKYIRHIRMKKIAHRVDKNATLFAPTQWFRQFFWHKSQVKILLARMPWNSTLAFGKGLCLRVYPETDLVVNHGFLET